MTLVGRAEPLQTLVSAVTRPPALVFVEGEAGIGKTSLVSELAGGRSRWVAVGHCIPLPEPFPFGAVLDCLRQSAPRLADVSELSAIQHTRRGRRGYGNDLSPRERDVARLVAGGATNREIAEVLFLSRRTVEQHVANVLRKLNLPSRTALTEPPGT